MIDSPGDEVTAMDGDEESVRVAVTVNGHQMVFEAPARQSLALFLRETVGTTSVHLGCEQGVCGACTVVYDGVCARSCLILAAQADGMTIETLEGASATGRIRALQEAFYRHAALQCGFCTSGMILTAAELLERRPSSDRQTIREHLSGNICRCTGYQAIVDAVESVALDRISGKD